MTRRGHASLAIQSATTGPDTGADESTPLTAQSPPLPEARPLALRPPEVTERLREKLIEQQYRARDLFKSSWLRLSGTAPLILLADKALTLIKRVQASIERRDSLVSIPEAVDCEVTDTATLEGWLQEIEAALTEIARQYSWLEVTCRLADEVREISIRLLADQRVSYTDLLPLATLIFDSLGGINSPEQLFPLPGLQVASIYKGHRACVRPSAYTVGVQAARYAAWALVPRIGWRDELPNLVLGALLQEVGWLALEPYVADSNRRGPRRALWLAHQHPQVGATILAGVSRIPMNIPPMVALHHEKLDGSGYPRRAAGSVISRMGRMLACVARTFELYEELSLEGRTGGTVQHVQRMGKGLRHEARCGWWEQNSVAQLVAAISQPEPSESDMESGSLPPVITSERTLELHGEQVTPPGSHTHGPAQQGAGVPAHHGMRHSHLD